MALAVALALAALVLLLLGEALGILPGGSPLGAPAARGAQRDDTPTPTVTASPPPTGTITLVSPISHQGPAGVTLTISGLGWGASSVTITANIGSCPATALTTNTLSTVATSGGAFEADPPWPAALTQTGIYTLCAYDGQNTPVAGPTYTLLTSSSPTLTLSPTNAPVNQSVTITGANFVGVQNVTVKAMQSDGTTHNIGTYPPDATGAFTAQYVPQASDVGSISITATSEIDPNASTPALSATAQLTVGAANTPTPTVAATTPPVNPNNNSSSHGPSVGVIIALVVGILLALLLIIGLVMLVIIRRNRADEDAEPGYGRGPDGRTPPRRGFGGETGYGRGYSGAYGAYSDEYPTSGSFASGARRAYGESRYGDEYADRVPSGGVSGWDDPEPDPNWRSRPMSGRRPALSDDSQDDLGYPNLGPRGGWGEATGEYTDAYGTGYTDEAGAYRGGYTDEAGVYGAGYPPGYTNEGATYGDQPVYGRRPSSGAARSPGAPGAGSPLSPPPRSGNRQTPNPYEAIEEPNTRPANPSSRPGPYGASYPAYPPPPLVPPGGAGQSGARSGPGRGGPTGGRGSGARPAAPDPRRSGPGAPSGWDDPNASEDGRGGW
ncbi:MAG TPA: hypothetical protein VKQ36_12630 [Ktedonobacterales bacterium]|nr:hypothetical protein [Ktedonobacterales bacterium]